MKKHLFIVAAATLLLGGLSNAYAQKPAQQTTADNANLKTLEAAVIKTPDSLRAHEAYLKVAGVEAPTLARYDKWMKQFPKSAIVPLAIGKALADHESPKAKPYLLKAVTLDPKLAEGWFELELDAERWGDFTTAQQYLKKATEAAPDDPSYAFYYGSSFKNTDPARYAAAMQEVAQRFPNHERGAQALYWLAVNTKDTAAKIAIYEHSKQQFPPAKFNWSASSMDAYADLLLVKDPQKAVALATELSKSGDTSDQKAWQRKLELANQVAAIKQLHGQAAVAALDALKLPRYGSFRDQIPLLKAAALAEAGQLNTAYDSLLAAFVKHPSLPVRDGIFQYGAQLHKNEQAVTQDIYTQLLAKAQPATDFSLERYLTPGKASLADFKGQVVLLTYWFPGCGPCRGEFPHFQHVIDKYKGKAVAYVGINIVPEQNDYVKPFLQQSGYTFTPLQDVKDREKGNMNNRDAAPVNFLLDPQGRLFFADFRIDQDNEALLETMINLLLTHQQA